MTFQLCRHEGAFGEFLTSYILVLFKFSNLLILKVSRKAKQILHLCPIVLWSRRPEVKSVYPFQSLLTFILMMVEIR